MSRIHVTHRYARNCYPPVRMAIQAVSKFRACEYTHAHRHHIKIGFLRAVRCRPEPSERSTDGSRKMLSVLANGGSSWGETTHIYCVLYAHTDTHTHGGTSTIRQRPREEFVASSSSEQLHTAHPETSPAVVALFALCQKLYAKHVTDICFVCNNTHTQTAHSHSRTHSIYPFMRARRPNEQRVDQIDSFA